MNSRLQQRQKQYAELLKAVESAGENSSVVDQLTRQILELENRIAILEQEKQTFQEVKENKLDVITSNGVTIGVPKNKSLERAFQDKDIYVPFDYMNQQVIENIHRTGKNITQAMIRHQTIEKPVRDAIASAARSSEMIFGAVKFADSPTWKITLKEMQDYFNSMVTTILNEITKARNAYTELNGDNSAIDDIQNLDDTQNSILEISADFNERIILAIGGDDGGRALNELAKRDSPNLFEMVLNRFDIERTESIATDRNFDRASVYIGLHCNRLQSQGITSNDKQWRAIYASLRLKSNLEGDALAAWRWFEYKNPRNMTNPELRLFNQEISRLKAEFKEYWKDLEMSDSSSDR